MTPDIHSGGGLVLQTKLHSPPLPTDLVERVKLIELLDRERTRPLTLVSAPAGYGKSVLVANWLEHSDWPSAWYSLDVDDGDLRVFLTYIVAALRTMFSGVCEQTLNLTKASELPSMSTLSTVLSNELDAIEQPFFLVLDDYHRIDAQSPVHELLENLLAHPPIPLHLVIVTRFDPPLSLERHRALAQVADIRLLDLRLSVPETRLLLQKSAHFDASETELANLDQELEGWVVGLKLAALALRRASSPDELLTQFRAGNREIRAYLIGEVLSTLPQDERDRLSRIALLDRFCAPLCDAICARTDGQTLLQSLLHENLFVIPLDISGQWYRFHHLFQELLQRELATQLDAREIEALHLTASRWFEAHDFIDEAIRHALAARDDLAAVEIVERHRHRELNADRWYVIERWLEMLPTIKEQRPNLLLARAWIAYERLDVVGLATIVERTLELLDEQDQGTPLWGELQYLRGAAFYWSGEGERSHECCLIARTCLPQEHQIWLGLTHMLIGVSSHMCGNTNQAIDGLRRELQRASPSQSMYFTRLLSGLCFTYTTAGDLIRARSEAVRMESVATQGKNQYTAAWGSYIQAFTFLHGYDLQQAADKFANAMEHRYILHRMAAVDSFAGLALCQQLMDQPDAAQRTIQALHDFALELGEPIYLETALSCEARMAVLQGSPTDALVWAGSNNTEPPQFAEMFMWLEVPALTRARVWIALGTDESLELACDLLDEIARRSRSWNLVNQLVETGALRCLTLHRLGRLEEADECLTDTLRLAAPGGWVRPFLEQGRAMAALMARLEKQHKISDFGRHVMSMFKVESAPQPQNTAGRGSLIHGNGEVIDTLTNRELAILELLAQRLQNKEIARRLFVSPETVKSHMKRLFHKLDVNNRRDAAAMAIQMFASSDAADH